jgi:hypothetical protein
MSTEYARMWREKNRERYNANASAYQRKRRSGGWPPGARGRAWERVFVNAVRGVIGLEDIPVTGQWGNDD